MKKKLLTVMICGGIVLAVAACGNQGNQKTTLENRETASGTSSQEGIQARTEENVKADESKKSESEAVRQENTEENNETQKKTSEVSEGSGGATAKPEISEGSGGATAEPESSETGDYDYSAATGADAASVESFLSELTSIVKSEDWDAFADLIEYPVTLNGENKVSSAKEFLQYVDENGVLDSFINEATSGGVIANGQGIGVGDGNIWLRDKNFDGITQKGDPDFVIISINGI